MALVKFDKRLTIDSQVIKILLVIVFKKEELLLHERYRSNKNN